MLEAIAADARRWTLAASIEIVLVVPIKAGVPGAAVAAAAGDRGSVNGVTERVLRMALALDADAVVLIHNHVHAAAPSPADLAVTRRLVAAHATIGIPLLAHLVVTPAGWYNCFDVQPVLTRWPQAAAA